ncbi:MAG: hypothetical protein OEX77_08810 [Candidatus Bathyarchaeota archaeon]|nr:hypothetical protein [Candidatus Bathyarchaeota archaeon]MDH5733916.1 hypothetical protein [Candidatus Bathyarchaeota archaeon]
MKIKYEPFQEIVVKEYVRYEKLRDLLYIFAQLRASGQPVPLNWAKGVVFTYSPLPPDTDQLMEDYLKGRFYIINVSFALMPEYKEVLEYNSPQGKIPVPVVNSSYSRALCELAEWLKKQK